jgi:hypothetical protein
MVQPKDALQQVRNGRRGATGDRLGLGDVADPASPLAVRPARAGRPGRSAGRRGTGTVNHCIHGKDVIIEEVLDWQPYEHVSYRTLLPIPNVPKLVNTFVRRDRRRPDARRGPACEAALRQGSGDPRVRWPDASTSRSRRAGRA